MNEQELLEAYKEKCPHAWKILEEKIRAEERARVVKEIGNECSDKDLNENIDWLIQTLSLFDVTDLDKKELCKTLESQKAMIVMHDAEIRANERKKIVEWIDRKFGMFLNYGNRYRFKELVEQYKKECGE